jgi:hypothetical protein
MHSTTYKLKRGQSKEVNHLIQDNICTLHRKCINLCIHPQRIVEDKSPVPLGQQ